MAFNQLIAFFTTLAIFIDTSQAQKCWKNTTCSGPFDAAFPGPWDTNIYSPASRSVPPKFILSLATGKFISGFPGNAKLSGNGSQLVFDFGIEVGGLVHLEYSTTGPGALGLAFTEAKNWIGEWSDSSNGKFQGPDGAVYAAFSKSGTETYRMPDISLRGGFRYLTIFLVTNETVSVDIKDVKVEIGFEPTWCKLAAGAVKSVQFYMSRILSLQMNHFARRITNFGFIANLRAYQGYFHSSDELLNKIWYSGAYTLQTNNVPPKTGRQVPFLKTGWANNGTLGPGDTIIVDGAKRDRAVWPGDMGVAVPSTFVSIGDLSAVKNALQVMYDYQVSLYG